MAAVEGWESKDRIISLMRSMLEHWETPKSGPVSWCALEWAVGKRGSPLMVQDYSRLPVQFQIISDSFNLKYFGWHSRLFSSRIRIQAVPNNTPCRVLLNIQLILLKRTFTVTWFNSKHTIYAFDVGTKGQGRFQNGIHCRLSKFAHVTKKNHQQLEAAHCYKLESHELF